MKFTVEIEDFWLDEEQDIAPALKKYIINDVVRQIEKSIEAKIEDGIGKEVRSGIEKSLYRNIQKIVKRVISERKVKGKYSSDPEITIEDYIKREFENNSGYCSPKEQIKKLADNFGLELKQRYDLVFASQIVVALDKNGLLKKDVAKILLESNGKQK